MSEREQVWRERIEWQLRSGLTVAECCEEAGVSVASFYRWKKRLAEQQGVRRRQAARQVTRQATRQATRRSNVQASGSKKRTSQFVPIELRDSSASTRLPQNDVMNHDSSMRLELPNGVVVYVASDLDGQRLGDVIMAAGQIQCVHADMAQRGWSQQEVLSC
jgi:hypothetical protein